LACDHACRANLGASQIFGKQIGRLCFAPRGRKNLNYGPKYWRGIDGRVSIQTLGYTGGQHQNFGVVTVGPNPNRPLVCRPKSKGGLGITNFAAQNEALLLEFLHNFFNKGKHPLGPSDL
jgi:hypothetical protein